MLSINPIWITLGPVVAINSILVVSYIIYQAWGRKQKEREFTGAKRGGSMILGSATREWWFWTTDPIVRLFVKLHFTPNILTATGFFFSVIAAWLFAVGSFGYAGWMMILGASFDMFDGRVARITGKTSRSGAYFDAVMDRFGEGACLLGLAFYFRDSFMLPIVIVALVGSLLVSYTKARAEGMGVECNVGWMQRPERIVYVGVSSILDPMAGIVIQNWWAAPPPILVILALIWIAIMTNATAVYRMIHVMNKLDTADKKTTESIPQLITRLSTQEGRDEFWEKARYGYDRSRSAISHAVLFLANGISPAVLSELLKKGELPNVSEHIISRGGEYLATSVFPSAVGPASAPFVTGCFPGTCNIPGVKWFDRAVSSGRVLAMNRFRDYQSWGAYAMDTDLSKSVRTIFEYSKRAVNIFGMLNRGCGLIRDPALLRLGNLFYRARTEKDVLAAEEAAFDWFSSAIRRETDFVLYSFPSLESEKGSKDAWKLASLSCKRLDGYVGRAAEILKTCGMYDDTVLLLSSIHGTGEPSRHFGIGDFLSKRYRTSTLDLNLREWFDAEIIALESGTSSANIYVRAGSDWTQRPFFEDIERKGLIGSLLEQDEIDIISGRSVDGGIVIQSRRGRAHVVEDADGRVTYTVKGSDPFGFASAPRTMDTKTALDISAESEYPDGILQCLQIFRSRRSGDIVISTAPSVVLDTELKPAFTNGSLAREHMLVPFLSSIPMKKPIIRTADVFARVIDQLGIEVEHDMDGTVCHCERLEGAKQSLATH